MSSSSKVHLGIHIGYQTEGCSKVSWLPCKAASSAEADVAKHFNSTITSGGLQKPSCRACILDFSSAD